MANYDDGFAKGYEAGERSVLHKVEVYEARCEFLERCVKELEAFIESRGWRVVEKGEESPE